LEFPNWALSKLRVDASVMPPNPVVVVGFAVRDVYLIEGSFGFFLTVIA